MTDLLWSNSGALPPEARLLLCCARTRADQQTADRIREVVQCKIDWQRTISLAFQHRVLPLLYKNLNETCPELVQPAILDALKNEFRSSAQRNMFMTAEMLRLLDIFNGKGISVIPFKGPVLAISAFGSLSLRRFGDLDILIHKRDIKAAKQVLLSEGYRPEFEMRGVQEAAYIQSEHAFQFVRDAGEVVVELHWRLEDRYLAFPMRSDHLWQRARQMSFFGKTILTLSPEDLFLYLCMHGAKHYWEGLEWICCLPELMHANPAMDWESIQHHARSLNGERILHLGVLLADQLANTPETNAALRLLAPDPVAVQLASEVWQKLFSVEMDHAQRQVYRYTFYLKTREKLLDRLRIAYRNGVRLPHPSAKDWKMFPLPSFLSGLLYFLRPMRLIRQYGLRSLKRVF